MSQHAVSMVAVMGSGSWGTALALLLARNGHVIRLWGHNTDHVAQLQKQRENRRYLPDHRFPSNLTVHADLTSTIRDVDLVLVVVPSQAYGVTVKRIAVELAPSAGFAWATKGLEHGTGRFLHQVTREILGDYRPPAMVSGPSFAREVASGLPTAITVASPDTAHARRVAALLHGPTMRAYTSADITGVEIGGAVKNVLAIAAGVADGLGFGANARAALITRGLAEMVRLGEAVGGRRETFMGLTGVGDLVLTCTDNQSRNRRFGLAIGNGGTAAEAQATIGQVVEGAIAARELMRLARQHGVDMPITDQIDRILHQGQPPRQAVETLLAREPKAESI
jgi:glycerol-3-phosphate dehydrogenase (NAD(P)+)